MIKIIDLVGKKTVVAVACLVVLTGNSASLMAETSLEIFDGSLTGWDRNSVALVTNALDVQNQNITLTNGLVSFNIFDADNNIQLPFQISPVSGHYMAVLNPINLSSVVGANSFGGQSIDDYLGLQANTFYNTLNNSAIPETAPTNVALISKSISLTTGVTYKFYWAYAAQDYSPFGDGVFFSYSKGGVGNLVILSRNGSSATAPGVTAGYPSGTFVLGDYGSTAWNKYSFSVSSTGTYKVAFGAFNAGDTAPHWDPLLFVTDELGVIIGQVITTGPSPEDTQASMQLSANRLKNVYALQTSTIVNGLSYDCSIFDKNGICVSTGGRYDRVNTGETKAANGLLIGAYKVNPNIRVGAWIDQNLSTNTDLGIKLSNSKPMFGVFGVWNANQSGEGVELKLSAGYGDKDLTVTRDIVGTSEAGTGTARLNTQGVSAVLSYNAPVMGNWVASPYLGARYTKLRAGSYTEQTSADVTAALTYSELKQEAATAMAGIKLTGKLMPNFGVFGGIGAELDTTNRGNNYSATGVDGLTSIAFNPNIKRLRGSANAGFYLDIDKTQRVSVSTVYREEAFTSMSTLSSMLMYTAGF